jgi:hypothetical protein
MYCYNVDITIDHLCTSSQRTLGNRCSVLQLEHSRVNTITRIFRRTCETTTHGYTSNKINTAMVGDVPEFTSRVHYGYHQYAQALGQNLPDDQAPLLAPVGLAFFSVVGAAGFDWVWLFVIAVCRLASWRRVQCDP